MEQTIKQKLAKFNFSTPNQNNHVSAIMTTTQVRNETLKSRFSIKIIERVVTYNVMNI